jgi:alkylation response protein AidB-like acyl-CoA dehydrogenase
VPGSELDELRSTVRDFLDSASSSDVVRRLMDSPTGHDVGVWGQMAKQLGLQGISVPEDWGGAGAGLPELSVVFEEMGAALLCAPFFSTVALAIPALVNSGDTAAADEFLPALVDGSTTATLVLNDALTAWDAESVRLAAHSDADGFRIRGEHVMALDGETADLILVAARTDAGISLFAVSAGAEGLERTPLAGLDRTRRVARLRFDDTPARLIGHDGGAAAGLARTADTATVLLAAEQVGGAQRCLDTAVGYAKNRIQFGRPIGGFQAVKHRCADMLVEVEGARSAVVHGAGSADEDDLAVAASVAKLAASDTFLHVAVDNMRVHGGIGFTWEHDAHLYVRRAKTTALMFGDPDFHAERLAALVATRQPEGHL